MSAKKLQDRRDESDEGDDLEGRDTVREDREFVPFRRSRVRASAFDRLTQKEQPLKTDGAE